jgi:hypothetical protein
MRWSLLGCSTRPPFDSPPAKHPERSEGHPQPFSPLGKRAPRLERRSSTSLLQRSDVQRRLTLRGGTTRSRLVTEKVRHSDP